MKGKNQTLVALFNHRCSGVVLAAFGKMFMVVLSFGKGKENGLSYDLQTLVCLYCNLSTFYRLSKPTSSFLRALITSNTMIQVETGRAPKK
jgi:hypothetical protein